MSEKRNQPNYSRLVRKVVRDSPAPLPFEEIMRRVEILRPVTTRSPTSTIRHAVTACPLIVNTGDGRFGWYPRLIGGSRVRMPLVPSHLVLRRIVFAHDARELIWPGFSARDEELVPGNTSLRRLHRIIQRSMGWTDSHLHQFIVDDRYYSDPSFELDEGAGTIRDGREATLNLVAGEERAGFIYEYDFGDCWRHE